MGIFSHNVYENVRTRVIVLSEGHVLLLLAERAPDVWMPPGGGLEPHESLAECARREVQEETGIDVRVGPVAFLREWIVPRFAQVPEGDGVGYGLEVFFYAWPITPLPTPRAEVAGEPPPRWFPVGDVPELPLWPKELKALCRRLAEGGALPSGSPSIVSRLDSPWAQPDGDPFAAD